MGKWTLTSSLEKWEYVDHEIEDELNEKGFTAKFIVSLMLAMDEIFANISMYAYSGEEGNVIIESSYDISDNIRIAKISFLDFGAKFNPLEKDTAPDIREKIASKRKIGGLGIFLTKKNVDEIKYSYSNNANILKLLKKENISSEVNHDNNEN